VRRDDCVFGSFSTTVAAPTWTRLRAMVIVRASKSMSDHFASGDLATTQRVTVIGLPQSTAAQANGWCDANGFDADHCFAKVISSTLGVGGTTVYRK
jgi:hypothetical protein